jgi:hypothetical protein
MPLASNYKALNSGSDRKRRRTSMSGKLPNVERNFEQGHRRIYDDYFSDNSTFSEDKFQKCKLESLELPAYRNVHRPFVN